MAMSMQQRLARLAACRRAKATRRSSFRHKFVKGAGLAGDKLCTFAITGKVKIFVADGEDAAWLHTNNRNPCLGIRSQQGHIVVNPGLCLIRLPTCDQRATTTLAPIRQIDSIARCFEYIYHRLTHLSFIEVYPSIVKEQDRP